MENNTADFGTMTTHRVSIVLPAYNREALVARSIDSVLAQTYKDYELIIVDDASTDNTRDVIQRYRDHPRVRLILSDKNLGGAGARNLGIEQAKGELIAFQDSDDVWLPHKLEAQVAALDADPSAGLCYCAALFNEGTKSYYIPEPVFDHFDGDMSTEILRRNTTSTQVLVVRRSLLLQAGSFDASLKRYQDWDLIIRIAQLTRFVFLPEPMVLIFATPGNISSVTENDPICRGAILDKYRSIFERAPEHNARNHYIAGRIWMRLGEHHRAKRHFKAAVNARPSFKSAVSLLLSAIRSRISPIL